MTDCTWEVQASCCGEDWMQHPPEVRARAATLAAESLRMLTAYRSFNCPVTIRPCRADCAPWPTYLPFPVRRIGSWSPGFIPGPVILGGQWFNIGCGCGQVDCSCTAVCEIRMPGEVASVEEVLLDGLPVDPASYRIDNGVRLVRVGDVDCWPLCQPMDQPLTAPGTFGVTYTPGVDPGLLGYEALGALACEFAKACEGQKCRLPSNVTAITRQGVTVTMAEGLWPTGITGIREVDMLVMRLNPHHLTSPSLVWTPDRRTPRFTTWPS